jgi:predicted RNA-binding protein with RPS1 domain/ribonuclease PH
MFVREGVPLGGKELSIEFGRMAKQADGSVVVRYGDSMVLVTAVASAGVRPGIDFMPLTVDYLEKTSAAGKIPGGYFKREGRMTEVEVLTSRLIDRPCRPLFPKGWRFDTQVIAMVLSTDRENLTDVLAMTGASAALHLSDIPWAGPFAGVRVGRLNGEFIVNPTVAQRDGSELDLIVGASRDAIVMVEGGAQQVSEEVIVDALMFAHKAAQPLIDLQEKLRAAVGKAKREFTPPTVDPAVEARVSEIAKGKIEAAMAIRDKLERYAALDKAEGETLEVLKAEFPERDAEIKEVFGKAKKKNLRELVLNTGRRIDGRATDEIRAITSEVSLLPRTHGSALFTRGETQSLVSATLGTKQDAQHIEGLGEELEKTFMLHYNFPAVLDRRDQADAWREPPRGWPRPPGRARLEGGASRREDLPVHHSRGVGNPRIERQLVHGFGVRRRAGPDGRWRSHQDARRRHRHGAHQGRRPRGRAVRHPRRRGSPGRHGLQDLRDQERRHRGPDGHQDPGPDPRHSRTSTAAGATWPLPHPRQDGRGTGGPARGAEQVRPAHLHHQHQARQDPRHHRPRGQDHPGHHRADRRGHRCRGRRYRAHRFARWNLAQKAIDIIKGLTAEAEVGEFYMGQVKRLADFGCFVEILPGTDGLVHISELDEKRVRQVDDICKEGDEMLVKVIGVDRATGKIRLSRREALGKTPDVVHNFRTSST